MSQVLGWPTATPYVAENYSALANYILNNRRYRGKTIVICWSHEYIAQLAAALRVSPAPPPWNNNAFDRAYVIKYSVERARFSNIPQKLLPGDAQR
jgi:hypothetical protein